MDRYATLVMIASLLLLLVVPVPASVEPLGAASEAFSRGDYGSAYRLIKPFAEQGLPVAQFNLGVLYENGFGVPQDYAEAVKWYRKAAEQGHVFARSCLGVMYALGQGVPQDYAEAAKWYRKAAEQDFAPAQYNLGFLYEKGLGVPQDCAEAVKWYRKAAEQGHVFAQSCLGIMYALGQGVPQDYVLAHLWFNLAIARFPASEQERREDAENGRAYLESVMTAEQVAEARELAGEWKPVNPSHDGFGTKRGAGGRD
jgi:uncharacterized protein